MLSSFIVVVLAVITAVSCHVDNDSSASAKCPISSAVVEKVFKERENVAKERRQDEEKLAKQGKVIKSNQRVADLCLIRQKNQDPANRAKELKQLPFEAATAILIRKYNLTREQVDNCLPNVQLRGEYGSRARDLCLKNVFSGQCDSGSRFRTADGTCNNLDNPRWGSAGTCFRRLLQPNYDGEAGLRRSVVDGAALPEPRTLSLNVHSHLNRPTNYVSHMYMFYGQLLDHDITQAPASVTVDNGAIECCGVEGALHPQCAPITIRPDDPFYAQFGTTCMNFVRSAICPTCAMGYRQQTNQITAFIDASFVYGNSLNETLNLRTNDGTGRMRVQSSPFGDLMPSSPDPVNDQCSYVNTSDICFLAGDARANQHTPLASLHTIFVREHNRLAEGLHQVNPRWDGERLFQEARRIVGAEMQVIAFKEYLPITLGNDRMQYFRLWMSNSGTTQYDGRADPTVYNAFSAAAFRFGHSLINSVVTTRPRNGNAPRMLRDEFFQPFDLRTGIITPLMVGVTEAPSQWFDRYLVPDVSNFLYRIRGQPSGIDLAAINIQRGRDHGTPTYGDSVRYCSEGEIVVRNFKDLVSYKLMRYENAETLRRNYRSVFDIDLWTGILSETPNEGAVVGPTGACIIGIQFHNLKFGDRFYFEHSNQAGSFTYQQQQELRKMTLSKIICLNTDVKQLPKNAMLFDSRSNPLIECRLVDGVDLSHWK